MAELEPIMGQKQLEIDFLNKLLEIGSGELGFDLKKKFQSATIEWYRICKRKHQYKLNEVLKLCNISRQAQIK